MSDNELTDKTVNDVFDKIDIPAASINSKKQAMNLALAEFSQYQQEKKVTNEKKSQGFWSFLRLTSDNSSEERKPTMMFLHNKLFYSGTATVFVAVIGVLLFKPEQTTLLVESELSTPVLSELASSESLEKKSLAQTKEKLVLADSIEAHSSAMASGAISINREERLRIQEQGIPQEYKRHPNQILLTEPLPQSISSYIGNDDFEHIDSHGVTQVAKQPISTFSIDVDTASYSFMRRQLNQGVLPQKDAIRLEELINYFDYQYPLPESAEQPFQPTVVVHPSPWAEGKQLLHIGIKGYDMSALEAPKSHIVLLLDVSGSMNGADRLPLVKQSMHMLLNTLKPDDTVGIVVYAGAAGAVLESTPVKQKQKILAALDRLASGGSTAGGEGIKLAYQLAEANFDKDAVNRIILATDGDFNVGIHDREELKGFVERKRQQGIFLSVLGFGQGNYNDHMMQTLAQNGNGVAAYIDSLSEAQKVLVDEATSTLFPIAKDVKIQIEFNPKTVSEYRLLGYETRHLEEEDFNNDKVDAGDIGAGHTVTAIYEITLTESIAKQIDTPRYQANQHVSNSEAVNDELAFLKVRYKLPKQTQSTLISHVIRHPKMAEKDVSSVVQREVNFATAVAAFGQLLKGGKYTNSYSYNDIIALAQANKGEDDYGYRTEFIQLVRKATYAATLNAP